jgi:hypothetical protein
VATLRTLLMATAVACRAWENPREEETAEPLRPIETLFLTELVYPQQKGEMQFTFSPSLHRERERDLWRAPWLIEYGLTDAWELGLLWDAFVYSEPEHGHATYGVGDPELEIKYSFMNIAGSGFHTAVGFGVQFPVGSVDKGISEGFMEYEPFVILAKDLPALHHLQLFTQVGVDFVQRVREADDADEHEPAAHELFWSNGFLLPIKPFVVTGEITWTNNRWNHDGEENELYVTPGLTWRLPHAWETGVGLPVGLTDTSDHWRLILHITKEF